MSKTLQLNDYQVDYLLEVLEEKDDTVGMHIKEKLNPEISYNNRAAQKANMIEDIVKMYNGFDKFKRILYNSRHDYITLLYKTLVKKQE